MHSRRHSTVSSLESLSLSPRFDQPIPTPTPSGIITMPSHDSRQTSSIAATIGKLFPRRTYSPSKIRTFVVLALACVSLVATTVVLHSFWSMPAVQLQHQSHLQMLGRDQPPASRVFRYKSDARARPSSGASSYSFAQHTDMELGALVGFLSLLASNSLPLTIDTVEHIDPELVLGFNTHAGDEKVQLEVETIVQDTWFHNPVVVFSELHSPLAPVSREAKSIIDEFHLWPEATVFEVDQRVDSQVLRPLLKRLTGADQLPVVLVAGRPYDLESLRAARDDGSLTKAIRETSATVDGALLRKKKHH